MSFLDKFAGRVGEFLDDALLPDEQRTQLLLAERALEARSFDEVLSLTDRVIAVRSDSYRAWMLRGTAGVAGERIEVAGESFRRAAEINPSTAAFVGLGQALEGADDLRGASLAYRRALTAKPDQNQLFDAHVALARVKMRQTRSDKAVVELKKALRIAGTTRRGEAAYSDAELLLGEALIRDGDLDDALVRLAEIVRNIRGEDGAYEIRALTLYGDALKKAGRLEPARDCLERAYRAGPSLDLQRRLTELLLELGDLDACGALLDAVPNDARAEWQDLVGRHAQQSGDFETARRALEAATYAHHDAAAAMALGWSYLGLAERAGDDTRARWREACERQLAELRKLVGTSVEVTHLQARVRLANDDPRAARRLLQAAIALAQRSDGATTGPALDLARLLIDSGEPAEAAALLASLPEDRVGDLRDEARRALSVPYAPVSDLESIRQIATHMRDRALKRPVLAAQAKGLQAVLNNLETPLQIAIVGEFNAGKSTLVNALLGEKVVPTGVLPTTAHINVMRYGSHRIARLHRHKGTIDEVAFSDVKRLVRSDPESIDWIEYLYPQPDLRRVNFWDTPGFNSPNAQHDAYARRALDDADAVFWVTDVNQTLSASEKELVDCVGAAAERLVLIVSKTDKLGAPEDRFQALEPVLAHAHEILGDGVRATFALSAKEATAPETRADSGIDALIEFADAELYDRVFALKASHAALALARIRADGAALLEASAGRCREAIDTLSRLKRDDAEVQSQFKRRTGLKEAETLESQLDFLTALLVREVGDAVRPSSSWMGTLMTRMTLDDEDADFLVQLANHRFSSILRRCEARIVATLTDIDDRFADSAAECLPDDDSPRSVALRRRLDSYGVEVGGQHRLLTETVFERYRLLALGRVEAGSAKNLIRQAVDSSAENDRRTTLVRRMLPNVGRSFPDVLATWAEEYFDVRRRLCDALMVDLNVMLIEIEAFQSDLVPEPKEPC